MNLPPAPLVKAKSLDSPLFQVGDTVLDVHQIRKRLGKGSTARSYLVHREDWQQDLILKVPRTALLRDRDGLAHWIKQANVWIGLGQSPQLITAYYLQIQQQVPYLVTDWVAGGYRLSERIQSGQLYVYEDSLKDLLDIAIQAATGLAYGHEQGLLHTHFKSSKVILTRDNTVKLTDFGLTPRLPHRQKMDSLLAKHDSTWAYASPEQLEGLELSVQSDIWSWAVTVLELFMGERTWAVGIAAPDVLTEYQQTAGEDESKPVMPQALFDLLDHCLQTVPAHRPRDMAAVLSNLTPIYMAVTQQPYLRFAAQSNRPAAAEFMSSLVLERITAVYEVAQAASSLPLPEAAQRHLQQARQALAQQDYAQVLIEIAAARSEPNCYQANEIMALWTGLYRVLPRLKLRDGWPIHSGPAPGSIVKMVATLKECYAVIQTTGTVQLWHPLLGLYDWVPPLKVALGTALAFSVCGRYAAIGYADHSIRLWDTTTRQCVQTLSGHPGGVTALALSADFHYLLSGGADGCVRLWDCASGHCLQQYQHHEQPLKAVALSADARYALSIAHNKVACQWPLRKPKQLQTLICSRIPEVIALSADGHLVAVSADNQVWLWSISSGQCVVTLKVDTVVTALVLDIDGQRVILGDAQGQIAIWGVTRKQCEHRLQGHQAAIQALTLALDGRYLLSTDEKGVVKQWVLDWKMEASPALQWDATLLRWVSDFLAQRQPYRGQLQAEHPPTVNEVHQALNRQGKPHWVETDLQQLMHQLACAGYGRLSRHELEQRLQVRLKFYFDPLQLALGLKHWVRHYWQQYQLRWSQRHLRALQKQDHTRRLQRQQLVAQSRQRQTNARLKRNRVTDSASFAPIWLDIARFTLLALVFHDLGHYGMMAFTSVVSAQSQPHNSVHLPINPLEAIDAVALKQAETQLALNFVEQRRELVTMIYANLPAALIQAEVAQIQATLDQVKAIIPIQFKLIGDQKHPQLRFTASIPGADGKSYAVPINMQRGSKVDIHYEPTFADRLAKQRNDYQAGKGAQWLWVQPYLLAVDGRLWHSPKPPVIDRL